MKRRTQRHPRGFTLIEVIGVLALLAVFGLLSAWLFSSSLRVLTDSNKAQQALQVGDSVLQRLERDVWQSSAIEVTTPQQVTLQTRDAVVQWEIDADGTITRRSTPTTGAAQEQRWPLKVVNLRFAGDGLALVLASDSQRLQRSRLQRMVSQVLLAGGARP